MTAKTATVFGATGTAGGGVMEKLLENGWNVRAVTSNRHGDKAKAISGSGAEVVEADLNDRASIRKVIDGVDAVYLSGPSLLNRWDIGQAVHGINVADAVREVEPGHFVYQSALVGDARGVLSVGSKRAVEERIAELQLGATIVRPGWFLDNFLNYFPVNEQDGTLIIAMALPLNKKHGLICSDDIGRAAVAVLNNPEKHRDAEIELVCDIKSFAEMAAIVGEEMGMPVQPVEVPLSAIEEQWPEGTDLYRWLSTRTAEDSTTDLEALIGKPTSCREWMKKNLIPTLKVKA